MLRQQYLTLHVFYLPRCCITYINSCLLTGARASGDRQEEQEGGEVWRRRRSMQASGGVPQNQEVCGARESQNGTAVVERETGEMQGGDGFQFIITITPD